MKYKFKHSWLKKNLLDRVIYNGGKVDIGQYQWQHRGVDMPPRGIVPEDQNLLKFLYESGKEYVEIDEPKKKKVKKAKLVKDEPKDINQESEEVSIQKEESE